MFWLSCNLEKHHWYEVIFLLVNLRSAANLLAVCTGQKACMISVRWRVRQLRLTKYRWETWLTTVIRHAISRVTVLVAVMNSRMMRTVHVPGWAHAEFHFCRDLSLPFGSAILKPYFNLSFSQLERFWKLCSTRDGQVFASAKFTFEFFDLGCREGGSFPLLGWISTSSSLSCVALVLQYWKNIKPLLINNLSNNKFINIILESVYFLILSTHLVL